MTLYNAVIGGYTATESYFHASAPDFFHSYLCNTPEFWRRSSVIESR